GEKTVAAGEKIRLTLKATEAGGPYRLTLKAARASDGEELARLAAEVDAAALAGNVALLSHFPSGDDNSGEDNTGQPSARFSDWRLSGGRVRHNAGQTYGPICFSQYSLDRGVLKMTTQLAPVEQIEDH